MWNPHKGGKRELTLVSSDLQMHTHTTLTHNSNKLTKDRLQKGTFNGIEAAWVWEMAVEC